MAEGYNGAFTGAQIDEAIGQVRGKNLPADGVKFSDGESLQVKLDEEKLGGGAKTFVKSFTAAEWSAGSGERTITIPAATHGMSGTAVQAQFFTLRFGTYVTGTWASMESYATIGSDNGIVLHCPGSAGYDGRVILTAIST